MLVLLTAPHRERRLVDRRAGAGPGRGVPGAPWRAGRRTGRRCRCSTPTTRCGSGSCWAGTRTAAALLAEQLEFWREALAGLPEELALPADRPRPARRPSAAAHVACQPCDAGLHAALAGLARARQATLFMVLQAALAVLLSRFGCGDRHPGRARRSRAVPTRRWTTWSGSSSTRWCCGPTCRVTRRFGELLDRVREADLAAYAHQDLPFERLVEVLNPARSPARHPLFQVMIADQDIGAGDWQAARPALAAERGCPRGGRQVRPDPGASGSGYDAGGAPGRDRRASWSTRRTCSTRARVEALADRLVRLLAQAGRRTRAVRVGDVDLLERRRASGSWRSRGTTRGAGLPAGGAAGAVPGAGGARPRTRSRWSCGEAVALTYGELDARAGRLARYLIAAGGGPGAAGGGGDAAVGRSWWSSRAGGGQGRARRTCRWTRTTRRTGSRCMLADARAGPGHPTGAVAARPAAGPGDRAAGGAR